MAEGLARALAPAGTDVWSAGSRPSGHVNPGAIQALEERGISVAGAKSKGLNELPTVTWDAVVTMGCGDACPQIPAVRRLDWSIPDPKGKPSAFFAEVRDLIEKNILDLFKEIETNSSVHPN